MFNKHPCVFNDPYQLAYEHLEEYQISDGEKGHFVATSITDMEFKKRIADIPIEDAASVLNSALNPSQVAKSTQGTEALENGKRFSDKFCGEMANKRAKKEDQEGKLGHLAGNSPICITSEENPFSEEPEWKISASVLNSYDKSPAATIIEVDTRQNRPAGAPFFPGFEYLHRSSLDQLEDVCSPHSEHSHRRCIPIGPDHQADLPQWTPQDSKSSAPPSSTVIEDNEVRTDDKWLGTCVIPMPMETEVYCSKEDCDCADKDSIRCVRQHVMEAREKLHLALGKKKFMELGFPDMGEDVARRWSEEEENLFHMIVLSNSASSGRNFWNILPRAFPSRSFKEIVSYYFNVFVLRMRADQNRMDPSNVDSDNDEWRGSSDGDFETSEEEEEEEDSAVESPGDDGNILTFNDDSSEEFDLDDEEDYEKLLIGTEDEGYKPMQPSKQPIDGDSRDCSVDQDESCTSFEGPSNVSDSCVERNPAEHRNNCMVGFADYDYTDGPHDAKPWEINYVRATEKDFDFFPTCNVIEEVFGKGV